MSPLEVLAPEAAETVPFSVRLAERRLRSRAAVAARADRRAHRRLGASDLDWLQTVRLLGGTGYDVKLVDLSEGGALIEVDAPLRPGVTLTLEMTGPGVVTAVPLEVLRCYIANLRGETAIYRGACVFAHLIELPGRTEQPGPPPPATAAADFVGTDKALKYLLERCVSSGAPGAGGVTLERTEVLHVLDALLARTSTRGSDLLSRHISDLLTAILPALRGGAPREVAVAALEDRLRGLPQRWQSLLEPTSERLASLIDHCATGIDGNGPQATRATVLPQMQADPIETVLALPSVPALESPGQVKSAFQRIVARHTDGKILKGYTQDFHPARPQFSLWPSINATPKERVVIPVARLKALFFVKDFNGNPQYQEQKTFGAKGQGRRVEVTFSDGEIVLGTTLSYRPEAQGFFVSPVDPAANNTRVFVVSAALRRVRFL